MHHLSIFPRYKTRNHCMTHHYDTREGQRESYVVANKMFQSRTLVICKSPLQGPGHSDPSDPFYSQSSSLEFIQEQTTQRPKLIASRSKCRCQTFVIKPLHTSSELGRYAGVVFKLVFQEKKKKIHTHRFP